MTKSSTPESIAAYPDRRRHVIKIENDLFLMQWFIGSKPMAQPHLIQVDEAEAVFVRALRVLRESR